MKLKLQRVAFTLLTLITPENCFLRFDLFSATKDKNSRLPTLCYLCYIMEVLNINSKLTVTALINQCVLLKSDFGYNMWFTFRLLLKSPFKKINQNDLDASVFEIIKKKIMLIFSYYLLLHLCQSKIVLYLDQIFQRYWLSIYLFDYIWILN